MTAELKLIMQFQLLDTLKTMLLFKIHGELLGDSVDSLIWLMIETKVQALVGSYNILLLLTISHNDETNQCLYKNFSIFSILMI